MSHDQRFKEFLREFFQKFLKGELKGKRETLLRLLAQQFGPLPKTVTARIEAYESVEELDACLERILTVTSLEEMGLET